MRTKSDKDAVEIYNLHQSDDNELAAILKGCGVYSGQGDSGTCDMCQRSLTEYIGRLSHMLHYRCNTCGWVTARPDNGALGEYLDWHV